MKFNEIIDLKWEAEFMGNLSLLQKSNSLDAFTWHNYPLGSGKSPNVDVEAMSPAMRDNIAKNATQLQKQKWTKNLPFGLWMGETGGASSSGRDTITNRYSMFVYFSLI